MFDVIAVPRSAWSWSGVMPCCSQHRRISSAARSESSRLAMTQPRTNLEKMSRIT